MHISYSTLSTATLLLSTCPTPATARKWRQWDGCNETIKTVIAGDPCQSGRSLSCTRDPQFVSMHNLHDALLHCANTLHLALRVTALGCADWPSRYNFPFNPAGGDVYPALRSLRLEGYDFERRPRWKEIQPPTEEDVIFPGWAEYRMEQVMWALSGKWVTWLRWLLLPEGQKYKSNLQLWLDAMDWSRIEHLGITADTYSSEMIEKLPPRLASLTSLGTLSLPFIEALPNNTLVNLTWVGAAEPHTLPRILARHGTSLQRLEYRCDELVCPDFGTHFENLAIILPNTTTQLSHLSIDVPRNGTWPLESLEQISSLPALRTVNFYSAIQSECRRQMPSWYSHEFTELKREYGEQYCQGEDSFQKPFVNQTTAAEVFEYMRKKNVNGNLQNVTFWVGDWMRAYDGPLWMPPWADGRRAKLVCSADEQERASDDACVVVEGDRYWKQETRY